jgi:hypothetical protein
MLVLRILCDLRVLSVKVGHQKYLTQRTQRRRDRREEPNQLGKTVLLCGVPQNAVKCFQYANA